MDKILSGLPPDHEAWTWLPLPELTADTLAPYEIITGVGAVSAFNQIEQAVRDKLVPRQYDPERGGILGAHSDR